MENDLANLRLRDEEEEAFQKDAMIGDQDYQICVEAFQKDATVGDQDYQICVVGRCLTDSVVHFPSLRNTMADLWHPVGGICISDLGDKRYLFQFFHEVDRQRVMSGTPWFFNNHLLILQQI
ncbi:hypothetical protein J1N35_018368 [Gossypium stocksii]|uniref:DUF4283 domain-containing protein n=1 Tax=Gossypium stocksii TaxID=47602 RepID=A0A9D3VNX5_9ROSI|nr:hypothetical protein J1N35_018368 [Gossypium stocksii]